tara:strand:- start:902 stop:1285 length:384 start_codon:yes stop_codon:yes gene_type:complete
MTRHNQIFARIKIKGLVGMLTDAADDLAARCVVAERIAQANTAHATGYGMQGCRDTFQRLDSPEHFKRQAAQAIIGLRRNRAALKRMGRNHYGSDARLLAKASGFRRDAQARLQHTPVAHPQAQAAE